jgi:prevent-host-death family protein
MRIAPVADIKARFSSYLNECREGPVVVTKNGRAVAVLLCVEDDDDLERLLMAHNPRLRRIVQEGIKSIRETGGLSEEELWSSVDPGAE